MRFIAYSDIHFWQGWSEFNPMMPSGLCKWMEIQINCWQQIHDFAEQYQVDAVLFAGDMVHKRSFIHTTVNNPILELYKGTKIPEVMISGNHDRLDQHFNAVQPLHGIGRVTVLPDTKDTHLTINTGNGTAEVYGALPGGPVPSVSTGDIGPRILLAHGILNGSKSADGFELSGGYNLGDFKDFDLVLLGDVHKRQLTGNVLIPGAPLQMQWGDVALDCGCWLIDTEKFAGVDPKIDSAHDAKMTDVWLRIAESSIGVKFLPVKAPRFRIVTQENLEEVLNEGTNAYDYFDFRLVADIPKHDYKELKGRFPNSYFGVQKSKDQQKITREASITRGHSIEQMVGGYYDIRLKGKPYTREDFERAALAYLFQANPKLEKGKGTFKELRFDWIRAENFMTFKDVMLDFRELKAPIYQITGFSDEETSKTNGIGKSTLGVEILSWVLFDQLARSKSRSKDRLIHDPDQTGKGKNMLGEVGVGINGQDYIIQRYRRHDKLGTGSRILLKQ